MFNVDKEKSFTWCKISCELDRNFDLNSSFLSCLSEKSALFETLTGLRLFNLIDFKIICVLHSCAFSSVIILPCDTLQLLLF